MLAYSLLLLISCALAGGQQFILHTNKAIEYLNFNPNGNHSLCTTNEGCKNQWWSEPNETGNKSISDEHTTKGPQASLQLRFKGTKTLALQGKLDDKAREGIQVLFQGPAGQNVGPLNAAGPSEGQFFSTSDLNSSVSYTMKMSYAGTDFLRIVGVLIDSGGTLLPPGEEPSSPPAPSATKGEGGGFSSTHASTTSRSGSLPSSGAPVVKNPLPPSGPSSPSVPSVSQLSPTGASTRPISSTPSNPAKAPGVAYSKLTHSPGPGETPSGPGGPIKGAPDAQPDGVNNGGAHGALIGGIVAGVLILLLLIAALYLYLRRRQRARRAPSYPFRARGFQFRKEVVHWTDRPISPIVPTSGDWEAFAFPPEKDEEGMRKLPLVSERRSTLSPRVGIAM